MATSHPTADALSATFFAAAREFRRLQAQDPDGFWECHITDAEMAGLLCQASSGEQAIADGLDPAVVSALAHTILDLARADLQVGQDDDARTWFALAAELTAEAATARILPVPTPSA